MITALRRILLFLTVLIVPFVVASPVSAAAPDGVGPWADSVLSASQGLMKNGSPVPAIRSDPTSALGVAENDTVDGHFYSLGFGGKIALGFVNGISSGVIVVEATNAGYPVEKAKVEVSENGTTWVTAGEVSQDGSVDKPSSIKCAKYVRITDISNPNDFTDATADGYDVDGVKATGDTCVPPTPTPPCCSGCSTVTQTNNTSTNTSVVTYTNTGGNSTAGNTGGTNTISTGGSNTSVFVSTTGGTNTNNSMCCSGNDTSVNISGNGVGSRNNVFVGSKPKYFKF